MEQLVRCPKCASALRFVAPPAAPVSVRCGACRHLFAASAPAAPPAARRWACAKCTLLNEPSARACAACGTAPPTAIATPSPTPPPPPPPPLPPPPPPWPTRPCLSCTLENDLAAAACAACAAPLSPCVLCDACTCVNELSAACCAACDAPLLHSPSSKPAAPPLLSPPSKPAAPAGGESSGGGVVAAAALDAALSESIEARRARHEAEAAAALAAVVACCGRHAKFDDTHFPPRASSIFLDGRGWSTAGGAHRAHRPAELVWLRSDRIVTPSEPAGSISLMRMMGSMMGVPQPWVVVRDSVSPSDPQQQGLGDCWLISALSVLAERPDLLSALLPSRTVSEAGAYQVRLCHDGEWRTLLLDDSFPCLRYGSAGVPAFAYGARRQLWVGLVEKAFAKLYGCYEALEGGTTEEAMETLTGYPCERLSLEPSTDREMLWAQLLSCHAAGFLCSASVSGADAAAVAAAEAMGLLAEHSYSLLRVESVRVAEGSERLVQLRNPWGREAWRGEWSAASPRWTAALRASLGVPSDGGTFWMSFADFADYFANAVVCRVQPEWCEVRVRGAAPRLFARGGVCAYELEAIEACDVELSLIQRNGRGQPAHELSDLCLLLLSLGGGGGGGGGGVRVLAASRRSMRPSTRCEAVLPQGKCVVLPLSFGPARGAEYVLRVGSAKLLLVTPTQLSERLVGEAVGHHVMAGGSVREPFNEMRLYTRQDASGWLLYAENRTSRRFTVRLDLSGSFNCLSSRGSLHSYDVIPPGHTQLLHALTMAAEGDSRMAFETLFGSDVTSPEVHSPEVEGLHAPHPIGGVAPAAARTAMPIQQLMHALGLRFLE